MSQFKKKLLGIFVASLVVTLSFTTTFQFLVSYPNEIRMFESAEKQISVSLPLATTVSTSDTNILKVNGDKDDLILNKVKNLIVESKDLGESKLTFKLFGVIPVKSVNVNVIKDIKVIPGGQTIGVKLNSVGIMIVGHHSIQGKDGIMVSPAEKAGIRAGDIIIKINGECVEEINDVVNKINKFSDNKQSVEVEILRDGKEMSVDVTPKLDEKTNSYRLGIYIRDAAAGVGTLTFYDPKSKVYGALGHVITDVDTQKPIVIGEGKILYSDVTSIDKGENGKPGGKKATLSDSEGVIGNITKNSPYGIFGEMYKEPKNGLMNEPMSIALPEEVVEGPAEILTVIDGHKVEKFEIDIVNVVHQAYPATKGLVIKVTDPVLLEKTGGIVQGMSGSPIIQNGKIIGAVTHVFVNDPTLGYGSFIEWMIRDADIVNLKNNNESLKAS